MRKPPDPGEPMWERVKATVRPLKTRSAACSREVSAVVPSQRVTAAQDPLPTPPASGRGISRRPAVVVPLDLFDRPPAKSPSRLREGLGVGQSGPNDLAPPLAKDRERAIRSGRLTPDMTVDLHDHHLAGAHAALARALDRAVAMQARVILIIAGKPRGEAEAPRGAIRRELATWLAHSAHAARILAVRQAHPRHGGEGAVYVLLRKQRLSLRA